MSTEDSFTSNASEVLDSIEEPVEQDVTEEETDDEGYSAGASEDEGSGDIQDVLSEVLDGDEQSADAGSEQEAVEEQIKELKKKLKLKVDGEEWEEEIDLNDENRLTRALQKEKAFDKRSQEWSQYKNNVNQFVETLKNDPLDSLSKIGVDVEGVLENYMNKLLEESELTPEQKAQRQMEEELTQLRQEKERLAKEKENAELERLRNENAAKIEGDILAAMKKADTILPDDSSWVHRKISEAMLFAIKNGYPQVKASDVIPIVQGEYVREMQRMFDRFPEEVIEMLVKKENLDRVRKKRVKRNKPNTKTAKQVAQPTNNKVTDSDGDDGKQMKTYKDLFDPRF